MESTLFPIKLGVHILLALVALLVFGLQFIRTHKKYHLLLAIAIPLSLLPYLDEENMTLFFGVGVMEALALISALVLAKTIDRDKASEQEADENASEEKAGEEAQPEESEEPEEAAEEMAEEAAEEKTENEPEEDDETSEEDAE